MSVILEFTVDGEFALGRVLGETTDQTIELERIVPVDATVMPFFWIENGDERELEASVQASDYIEHLHVLDRVGDRTLYRVEWTGKYEGLIEGIADTGGTILEARSNGEWRFRLRFADHQHLADFYAFCTDHDIAIRVERVFALAEESIQSRAFSLTDEQREALLLALERGYFSTPREVKMTDLAAELDISQQAFSDRLRRGEEKILRNALLGPSGT